MELAGIERGKNAFETAAFCYDGCVGSGFGVYFSFLSLGTEEKIYPASLAKKAGAM